MRLVDGSLIIVPGLWAIVWMVINCTCIVQVHMNVEGMIVPIRELCSCLDHSVVCNSSCRSSMSAEMTVKEWTLTISSTNHSISPGVSMVKHLNYNNTPS